MGIQFVVRTRYVVRSCPGTRWPFQTVFMTFWIEWRIWHRCEALDSWVWFGIVTYWLSFSFFQPRFSVFFAVYIVTSDLIPGKYLRCGQLRKIIVNLKLCLLAPWFSRRDRAVYHPPKTSLLGQTCSRSHDGGGGFYFVWPVQSLTSLTYRQPPLYSSCCSLEQRPFFFLYFHAWNLPPKTTIGP